MTEASSTCPDCGTLLPADSPQQLCPSCLLKQAFASRTVELTPQPASPPPSPEEIADKFPQFEITECLGRGGMGVVYKARQKSLNRWVAIKILAPEKIHDEKFAERFTREAQTLALLNHPNIVTVHDYGETDGLFYIVMEFVDGVNLRDLLRDGKIESSQALTIVPPICEALQYAHDKGIVHRDIKPENLLIDREGRVKIADFGIASLVGASDEKSGTPPYMAPEQGNHGNVDHRADIYALGAVLYEMLTGDRPNSPLDLPSQKVQLDIRIDDIVLRALSKEPERRYRTANEFRTVVENITPQKETTVVESPSAPTATPPTKKRGMISRFWWIFLLMIPVAILLGLGARLIWLNVAPKKYEAHSILQMPFSEALMARNTMLEVIEIMDLKQRWNLPEDEVVEGLKSMISIQPLRGTDLIEIQVRGTNPSEVADIANTTAQVFQTRVSTDPKMAGKVIIHEVALEPSLPVSPNRPLNLVVFSSLGLILSPALSLALIAMLHRLIPDRSPPKIVPELTEEAKAKNATYGKFALWLFLAGTLGTLAMMTLSYRHDMALIFGGVALLLSLVFGLMSRKRGVIIALIVVLVILGAFAFIAAPLIWVYRSTEAEGISRNQEQLALLEAQIAESAAREQAEKAIAKDQPITKLTFGPVIERTVNDDRPGATETLIDFDTGKLFTPPSPEIADWEWTKANGIDAIGCTDTDVLGLLSTGGTVIVPTTEEAWLNPDVAQVRQIAIPLSATEKGGVAIPGTEGFPSTFIFKTRGRTLGLLQIVGLTGDSSATKIRYRLIVDKDDPTKKAEEDFERIARLHMEAVRRMDIKAVRALWLPHTELSKKTDAEILPNMQETNRAFEDDPARMTTFSEWYRIGGYALARVTPPEESDGRSIYLILGLSPQLNPNGWGVIQIDDIRQDESLSEKFEEYSESHR